MADRLQVALKGEWSAAIRTLDPVKLQSRLRANVKFANKRIGRRAVRDIRRSIRSGSYARNSPITVILKGSSKPLVDKGDLFQSITFSVPAWNSARIGLIRAKAGPKQVNIGAILHEGATIDTNQHPQVRKAVWAKIRAATTASRYASLTGRQRGAVSAAVTSLGIRRRRGRMTAKQVRYLHASGKIKGKARPFAPWRKSTGGIWRIPARPFITQPLGKATFVRFVRDTWATAIEKAIAPKVT